MPEIDQKDNYQELRDKIDQIPDGEWWKSESYLEYFEAGVKMIKKGFTTEETTEILASLYWAAASCYGG